MELGKNHNLQCGIRDAVHVPIVSAQLKYDKNSDGPKPGDWVKFTDDTYREVEVCPKEEAMGR